MNIIPCSVDKKVEPWEASYDINIKKSDPADLYVYFIFGHDDVLCGGAR